jgi:hypothetical protein
MAAVYAVAPRPASLAVRPPCVLSVSYQRRQLSSTFAQAGPSTSHAPTLKKKPSISSASSSVAAAKRKRNDTPDDTSGDSASPQPPRKPRDGPKKKKANRACYHCQKAHLTCDDCKFSAYCWWHVHSHRIFVISATTSTALSALRQTRIRQQLHRRPSQKGQVPSRRGGVRCVASSAITVRSQLIIDHVLQNNSSKASRQATVRPLVQVPPQTHHQFQ